MKYVLGGLIILFASYSDIFLYRIGIIPVPPAEFLLPLFMGVFLLKYSIKDFIDLFRSHSFKLFLSILIFSITYAAFSQASSEIITQKIVLNTFTLLLYTFVVHYFRAEDKKTVIIVVSLCLAVLAGSMLYDFFIGLPKYNLRLSQNVRKGGFAENPNGAASGIKFLALGLLVLINKNKKLRYFTIAVMVITVFLTLSRSGMVSIVLILIFGTMNNWSSKIKLDPKTVFLSFFKIIALFSIIYISLLSFSEVIRENFPQFSRGAAGQRMDMLLGKSELKIDEGGTSGGRGVLLVEFFIDFLDHPMGRGTGYSSDKNFNNLNSHNYFLYLGINFGLLSLLIYLYYIGYSVKLSLKYDQFYYLIFVVLMIFEGFVSHNIWHTRTLIICLALFDSQIYRKFTDNQNELPIAQ
ncbi:O-antigen ligase family protein [Flavivirga spongiicola]|uniref:O-antigen ligase family protein n=1 Tax=Flavivirga spongiicola TaxID=421621 RepID=A0ABU7XYJ5_9FLAO|nr:O-antigen ligase family protein [Flavivirga sp. MEBiC05379]MDO5980480.1 O-antigen ligase family protein [Flavivirga sp. MEBiC05379]